MQSYCVTLSRRLSPHGDFYNNMDDPYANNSNNPYGPDNQNPYAGSGHRPESSRPNGDSLAMAAMLLGILSVAMCFFLMFHLSLIFGSIGITLALLSKGWLPKIAGKAKTGIICAAAGVIMTSVLCCASFIALYTNPKLMDQVNEVFETQYGISYEELMETLLNNGQ